MGLFDRWARTRGSYDSVGGRRGPHRHASDRRVLIVEDDPELWSIFDRFSARVDPGLRIDFAASSDEALRRLSSDVRYDAVVTDYCLPEPGDGKRVRDRAAALQPEASLGTVSALMGYRPKGIPFLAKPFTHDDYQRFLQELLGTDPR